jgi:two-component system nitrate/nitrite sensor histidine kinase NarX
LDEGRDQVKVERRPVVPGHVNRLRWVGVILPVAFILSLEAFRFFSVEGGAHNVGHFTLAAVTICGVILFAFVMFRAIEATQRQLIRQNRELTAINAVSTAVQGELGVEVIMDAALESVIDSTGATEATIRVFPPDGHPDGPGGFERHRVATAHATPLVPVGSLVPHLIDIPLSTGASIVGRLQLHLPVGVAEPDLLASATLNNIGHQLAVSIQVGQFVVDLKRRQREGHGIYSVLLQISNQADLADILSDIVRHARELLGADEATMCLSETSSRAIQLDVPAAVAPALMDGTICMSGTADRFVAPHERTPSCKVRFAADIGPTVEVPIRSPDGPLGDIWLGRRSEAAFTDRDRQFLVTLSDLASIAISSARMRESGRQGAIVAERERIAREMHDSLAQILGVTHLRIVALGSRPEIASVARAAAELADLATLTEEAYRDVREAILGLREASRVDRGFIESLEAYLEKYSHQSGIPATLETSIVRELALPPRSELQIIRVIQEALTNVRKHGAASSVAVRIGDGPEGTTIVIADDGHGFDVAQTLLGRDGFGLHTMRERMELVGGTLTIDSALGHGTRIIARMPRPAQAGPPLEVNGARDDSHPHPAGR